MLFGLIPAVFADSYDDGYRIGYAIGYVLGALLWPGLVFLLLFCFRRVRHPALCFFWALGLLAGFGLLFLQVVFLIAHPEVLEPPPDLLPSAEAAVQVPAPEPGRRAGPCRLFVTVPADAEVFVQEAPTSQRGTTREFVSPPLEPGWTYRYKVAVRYRDANGQTVEEGRELPVRSNSRVDLDFTRSRP